MDKKRLEQFKARLEERQKALRRALNRTAQDGREADVDAAAADVADRAASSYTFGQCISCGEEINPKRLEAVPWTRFCIECQEKMEKGQLELQH